MQLLKLSPEVNWDGILEEGNTLWKYLGCLGDLGVITKDDGICLGIAGNH